jgi:hypothetical protein
MTEHTEHDSLPQWSDPAASPLIASLNNPQAFDHPVKYLRMIETHISWVVLTGRYAYKIKKPVNFGFLDFSTLEKRHHYCVEELRLNRRFAPEIYLELVEIRGSENAPRIGGSGEVIEYAIKMLEFPQHCLLSARAAKGELDEEIIDAIADTLAATHIASGRADPASEYGSPGEVARWSDENLVQIAAAIPVESLPNSYFELKRWYRENVDLLDIVDARRAEGRVRDCHGDLHLGNMAMIDGKLRFFDCIEFNPELRWIDTISETAFVAMDLHARGYPGYCWRFLNRYFERGGDFAGIALLRYYFVYRALVRAKVEALRARQQQDDEREDRRRFAAAIDYIDLAAGWAGSHCAGLILMHGLSGSGKSTVAAQLVERLGAIQLRSDVERKRLFELDATDDSDSGPGGGIYTAAASDATYRRLYDLAMGIVAADFTVIVDATLLEESKRKPFLDDEAGPPMCRIIIDCTAPEAELRRRIAARSGDASEATLEILDRQLRLQEPIGEQERELASVVEVGGEGLDDAKLGRIRELLFS